MIRPDLSALSAWVKSKMSRFVSVGKPGVMDHLLPLVKSFEGFYPNWYTCPGGVRTIGYGHTGPSADLEPAPWTEEYASLVLEGEMETRYIPDTQRTVSVSGIDWNRLSPHQQAALVSFVYNLGPGAVSRATFIRKIAAGANPTDIEHAWWQWHMAGGKIQPGLVRRRFSESKLYFTGKLDLEPSGWRDYYEAHR